MADEKEPCNCGQTSLLLNDPETGFKIDEHNRIILETWEGSMYPLFYCNWCGGRLPDSSKPIWYPRLDSAERGRIAKLLEGLETADQAIERLGSPDYDGWTVWCSSSSTVSIVETSELHLNERPDWDYNADESIKGRNMAYYDLSEAADIEFYFESGIRTHTSINVKNLPPRHIDDAPQS